MVRAVVFVLVTLQTLVPPGMCVHELGVLAPCHSPAEHDQHQNAVAAEGHGPKCCPGAARSSPGGDLVQTCDGGRPPADDHDGPCPPGFCQAQFDKFVPADHPQPVVEAATPFEVVRPDPAGDRRPASLHASNVGPAPPRYVMFCSFLI